MNSVISSNTSTFHPSICFERLLIHPTIYASMKRRVLWSAEFATETVELLQSQNKFYIWKIRIATKAIEPLQSQNKFHIWKIRCFCFCSLKIRLSVKVFHQKGRPFTLFPKFVLHKFIMQIYPVKFYTNFFLSLFNVHYLIGSGLQEKGTKSVHQEIIQRSSSCNRTNIFHLSR